MVLNLPVAIVVQIAARQRHVNEVLCDELDLKLVRANHIASEEIVRAVVSDLSGAPRRRAGFLQVRFVSVEQPMNVDRDLLTALRRPRSQPRCRHVVRHSHSIAVDAADER